MDYFVAPPVLFNSSELGFDFFAFTRYKCLTKELEENAIESSSSYVRLFGFYARQNMNSAANFVFASKTSVSLAWFWCYGGSYLFQKYSSLHSLSEFEQHMYSSDPRRDTGSLMQLESRRAAPQVSQPHNPKAQPGHFNNSTTRRSRREKPLQTLGSSTLLSFSCFSIANQEAVSRSAALLLRIKALALQKRPLFALFALVGRTAPSWMWQCYAQYRVHSAKQGNYLPCKMKHKQ